MKPQLDRSKFLMSFDSNKTLNENYDLLENSNEIGLNFCNLGPRFVRGSLKLFVVFV